MTNHPTPRQETAMRTVDPIEQGVRHFRAVGASWVTAAERAAESAIQHLHLDPASGDAFALRAAFAATARSLAALERGC